MKLAEKFKKDKKGFTLIEMIVVIVIIGILLAILVPGIIKYIDQAKDKQIVVDARTAYLAFETMAAQEYGKQGSTEASIKTVLDEYTGVATTAQGGNFRIKTGLPGAVTAYKITSTGTISTMTYAESGKTTEYDGKNWTEPVPVPVTP